MYGIVYIALNVTNNKAYIGQTTGSLTDRKIQHYYEVRINRVNQYFHRALKKYKDWEWNILQFAYCKTELDALEKYWIWVLNSMSPNGYNLKEGGAYGKYSETSKRKMIESQKGHKNHLGHKHTEESKRKNSEAHKGRKHSAETKKRMSESSNQKGKNNGFYGKHHTRKWRRAHREFLKSQRIEIICQYCSLKFVIPRCKIGKKYCSTKCRIEELKKNGQPKDIREKISKSLMGNTNAKEALSRNKGLAKGKLNVA